MSFTVQCASGPVRVDALEPPNPTRDPTRHPALVLLHGAGGNSESWLERLTPLARQLGLAVYAVRYFDSTGTTRATPAMLADGLHVPQWLLAARRCAEAIGTRPGVDPTRVALIGVSLGAFLSLALAAQGLSVRAIVEISGGLVPPYQALATASFPPVLLVHGQDDPVVPVSMTRELAQTLLRLRVPHRVELLAGEGHWFSSAAQQRILTSIVQFLGEHLLLPPSQPTQHSGSATL